MGADREQSSCGIQTQLDNFVGADGTMIGRPPSCLRRSGAAGPEPVRRLWTSTRSMTTTTLCSGIAYSNHYRAKARQCGPDPLPKPRNCLV